MKNFYKNVTFWMGIAAVLLVLGRVFIYTSSRWENVLPLTNFPLHAFLHSFFQDILSPVPAGPSFTQTQIIIMYLPYYALFVLTYIGYGLLTDVIIRKVKKHKVAA